MPDHEYQPDRVSKYGKRVALRRDLTDLFAVLLHSFDVPPLAHGKEGEAIQRYQAEAVFRAKVNILAYRTLDVVALHAKDLK